MVPELKVEEGCPLNVILAFLEVRLVVDSRNIFEAT
jgi:hypothetical protein